MGHERVGHLPKSKRWRDIVEHIGKFDETDAETPLIVQRTLDGIRSRFDSAQQDAGVKAAFEFLVILSISSRSSVPQNDLRSFGIDLSASPTPLNVAKAIQNWVEERSESPEYARIAQRAATDTVIAWTKQQDSQTRLFASENTSLEVWGKAASGAGFCEVSRLFFANFTERYLNYFLEREATSAIHDIDRRNQFATGIHDHVIDVSKHAFETAKITQSFAAGWFNKNASRGIPSSDAIEGFLTVAFKKLRDEFRREGDAS